MADKGACRVELWSSRVCERGTKSCEVYREREGAWWDRVLYRVWLFISNGPCRVCGRRWFLGWTVLNLQGVCSWRCLRGG